MLPEMIGAINILNKKHSNLVAAIASTPKTKDLIKGKLDQFNTKAILIDQKDKIKLFDSADFAIAKSGTNTLEMSMYELPMIITYRTNFLTYILLKLMVKVKFANLVNLILNKEIIPEMLQFDCNAKDLASELSNLIDNKQAAQYQINESKSALKMLGLGSKSNPSTNAAKEVLEGFI
jgi:lipid-A-disaccharide synthase